MPRAISYLVVASSAGALLAGIYVALGGKHAVKAYAVLIPLFINAYVGGSRAAAIWSLLFFVSPFIVLHKEAKWAKRRLTWMSIAAICLVALFIAVSYARGSLTSAMINLGGFINYPIPAWLTNIVVYGTAPFVAFSEHLGSSQGHLAYGSNLLTPIAKLLDRTGIIPAAFDLNGLLIREGSYVPFWFNTYTYLRDWYDDFGLLGMVIGPYFLGLVSEWLFLNSERRFLYSIVLASVAMTQILFSFTASITSFNNAWIACGLSLFAVKRVKTRTESRGCE